MTTNICADPKCQNEALHKCAICERDYCKEHCVNKGGWICWDDWRIRTGSQQSSGLPFFLRSSLYEAQGQSPNAQAVFIIVYVIVLGAIAYLVVSALS